MHLAHPSLISHRDKSKAYDFIYNKFKTKLTLTRANTLSHAGRLTLIESVFASIPIYYMSNMLFTKKFLAKITTLMPAWLADFDLAQGQTRPSRDAMLA